MPRTGRHRRFAILSEETSVVDISSDGTLSRSEGSKGSFVGSYKLSPSGSVKSTNKLQSLFNPFGKTQDKMDQLSELLNTYSHHGLPILPDWITRGRPHYDPKSLYLERHWTDIVKGHEKLNKRQREQQEALWELLSTEAEYIKKLKVVIDLFYCCLVNLQSNQLLNEINMHMVFSNVCEVFYSTSHFWEVHMNQVLKRSRETSEPLDPCLLKSGFQVFDKLFEPYIKYCLDLEHCREYLKCKFKDNDLFRMFISWAETHTQCTRLSLVDLIAKPFQRLTKYTLLLYAIKKPLDKMEASGDVDQQRRDIAKMVDQVERFVLQVNRAMRLRHEHMQLSIMMDRIDSYEAIEVPSDECLKLTEQFCKLDLSMPVPGCGEQERRNLLFEGSLRLKDNYTKTDVYCFLFTDMLLITKPTGKRGDKVKVIKPPMRLDKIIVQSMRDVSSFMLMHLNEYSMAQAVYTFHGDSKIWLAHLTKAQREFQEKRSVGRPPRVDAHSAERGGSCDSDMLTRSEGCPGSGKLPKSSTLQSYRSQLSVPSLFADSMVQKGAEERKISSERIKRKFIHSSDQIPEPLDEDETEMPDERCRLSMSSNSLVSPEETPNVFPSPTAKRTSISHHRRHSSDPIRDLESLNCDLLSASFPSPVEGEVSAPIAKKLGWNLGESISQDNQTETDASSGKNSDGSNSNLDSTGSKTSLILTSTKLTSDGTDAVPPDKSSSDPYFRLRSETGPGEVQSRRHDNKITVPVLNVRRPSTADGGAGLTVCFTTMLNQTEEDIFTCIYNLGSYCVDNNQHVDVSASSVPGRGRSSPGNLEKKTFGGRDVLDGRSNPAVISPGKHQSVEGNSETDSEPLQSCEDESSIDLTEKSKSRGDTESEMSESNRSPEEEFHLCYLPEEYTGHSSPPQSPFYSREFPPWKQGKGRHRAIIVVEASTQTPLEFLIAGYFNATPPIKPTCEFRSSSKSLPNIFDIIPSAMFSVPATCAGGFVGKRLISASPKDIVISNS